MGYAYASELITASADDVWRVVRDFDGLPAWHPAIETSEIEQDRSPAEVGCVRRLTLGDGAEVRERLCALDDPDRSCRYEFVLSPFAVRTYVATMRVHPVTTTGHSFVEWFARFDADAADEEGLEEFFRTAVFTAGLQGLARHLTE